MKVLLYVVRHGQTMANSKGVLQGHQDSPLTALGVQGSASTGTALKDVQFSAVSTQYMVLIVTVYRYYSPVNINVVFWPNAKNLYVARNLLSFKIQHQDLDSGFVTIISNTDPNFVKIP